MNILLYKVIDIKHFTFLSYLLQSLTIIFIIKVKKRGNIYGSKIDNIGLHLLIDLVNVVKKNEDE